MGRGRGKQRVTEEVRESRAHGCYRQMQLDYCKAGVAVGMWAAGEGVQGVTRDSSQKNSGEKRAVYLERPNNLSLNRTH